MDDEDLIEEIDDNSVERSSNFPRVTINSNKQSSNFPRRTINNNMGSNTSNTLRSSGLNRNHENNKKNSNLSNTLQNRGLNRNPENNKKNAISDRKGVINSLGNKNANKLHDPNKLKRKNKPLSFLSKRKNDNNLESNNNSSNNQNETTDDNDLKLEDVVVKAKKIILLIKLGIIVGVIFLVALIIMAIISFIGSIFGISDDFSGLGSTSNIEQNTDYYREETLYHENLNKVSSKYANSCGVYLNISYIHATLSYLWNISDSNYSEKEKYQIMADNVNEVANLMVSNCAVDYEIDGLFYNKLKNSNFLKKYYSKVFTYMDAESITKDIFEYAELGIELAGLNSGFISDKLKVKMGTCEYPYTNKLLNDNSSYSSIVGFSDYVMGAILGEKEDAIKPQYKEFLKAFTIVTSSYALGRAGYKSGDEEIWVHNGNCWQLSCDIHEGCTYCGDFDEKYGTTLTGMGRSCKKFIFQKKPLSPEKRALMDEVFKEVFGTVMIDNNTQKILKANHYESVSGCGGIGVGCLSQEEAKKDSGNGMNYLEILEKYYNNFTLTDMLEDSYVGDVSYDNGGYTGNVVYYDQTDYNQSFCGLKRSIKTDGCGVTSMAMVLSTFVNRSYTPPVVMNEAYGGKYCGSGISGTSTSFFRYSAQKHGLSYSSVGKNGNKQQVIDALKSGNSLVIAHMGPGTFTNGGHYIVLTKINEKGQAYVLDSNNSRRTGWHDFNEVITKQLKSYGSFHIITKR